MQKFRTEVRHLAGLATPVALAQLGAMLLWTIDMLFVGRVGVLDLNAVSLGRLWIMGTTVLGMGIVYGLDALASQAHGARDRERLADILLHGWVIALLVSVPLLAIWLGTERVLLGFGQDPQVAALAHRYVLAQAVSLPAFLVFLAFKQHLQARGIVRPTMWIAIVANVTHAFFDWIFVFGRLGVPRLGAVGAGVATAITEFGMLAAMLLVMRANRLERDENAATGRRRVRRAGLAEIAALGVPVSLQLAFEYWAFGIAMLWAGKLGAIPLAAHGIAIQLASISYMVPLGVASGATTRVGNLIGAGDREGAQRAAWVAFALGAGTMAGFALLFLAGRFAIPGWFTTDTTAIALAAELIPIVAAFELFDGLQVVGSGIFRGMGRTRLAAIFNFIGYYVFALPLARYLGSPERMGLRGIWWGLALGLATVAVLSVAWIAWRGPRTAHRLDDKKQEEKAFR